MKQHYLMSAGKKGMKSFDLDQYPDDAWDWISGAPDNNQQLDLMNKVDWLYRATELIMISIADIPFYLTTERGTELDSSYDWQNTVGFMPDPFGLIQLIGGGLFLYGYAYLLRDNALGTLVKNLRYMRPKSITAVIDDAKGLTGFERMMPDGTTKKFEPAKDIVYFWLPDSNVEIGPPLSWPAQAAFSAAAELYNMSAFKAAYFERGAVKATILQIPPNTKKEEASLVKIYWQKFVTGVKNAFASNILSTEVKTTVIGEGLEALSDKNLTDQARQSIATAAGIPQSLLLSNAANYATALQDKRNLYDNKLIPWSSFIANIFNQQLFKDYGYKFKFAPEEMELYQQDENDRAQALKSYTDAGMKLSIAAEMLGLDLPEGVDYADLDPEPKPIIQPAVQNNIQPYGTDNNGQPAPQTTDNNPTNTAQSQQPAKSIDPLQVGKELSIWQKKCLKAVKNNEPPNNVDFVRVNIPIETYTLIQTGLADCANETDVRLLFANANEVIVKTPEPIEDDDGMKAIARELKRANDYLEQSLKEKPNEQKN